MNRGEETTNRTKKRGGTETRNQVEKDKRAKTQSLNLERTMEGRLKLGGVRYHVTKLWLHAFYGPVFLYIYYKLIYNY